MAAIGAIRKHGILLMVIIGVALLAFLLGDMTKVADFFSDRNTMVKIENKKFNDEYQQQYQQNLALWRIVYDKSSLEESENFQVHEMTWNQLLSEELLNKELDKLGLMYSDEMKETARNEMNASLYTQQPNQLLYKLFTVIAEATSSNEAAAAFFNNIEDYQNAEGVAKDFYDAYKAIERMNILTKKQMSYFGLVQGSQYFSDVMAEKLGKENQTALVTLAMVNPNDPVFQDIVPTVSKDEIKAWYKEHKKQYKNNVETRDIDVAIFQIAPSNEDLKNIEDSVRAAYARFTAAPSIADFNITEMKGEVDSTYYKKEDLAMNEFDSLIFNVPVGSMIEPFNYEGRAWYYGKVFGMAYRPDSLQVAYLVLDYKNAQNQQSTRTKKAAKREADSLKTIIDHNPDAIFEMLPNYLAGRKATDTTMWIDEHTTYRPLYDSLLKYSAQGKAYVQKNQGVIVVFSVRQRTAPVEKRQFVIYTEEIKPSDATVNAIQNEALQLANASVSSATLLTEANNRGVQVLRGNGVTAMSAYVGQLPNCRDIVTWAFNEDTKKDDVSEVMKINNMFFTVATLRNINEKGIAELESVSDAIEAELMAKKKLEMVEARVKEDAKKASIATLAAKYHTTPRDSVRLGFALDQYQNAQVEDKAIAKIFALNADNSTNVVSGNNLLYLVAVHNMEAGQPTPNYAFEKMMLRNTVTGRNRNEMVILDNLIANTKIVDNRCRFYQK